MNLNHPVKQEQQPKVEKERNNAARNGILLILAGVFIACMTIWGMKTPPSVANSEPEAVEAYHSEVQSTTTSQLTPEEEEVIHAPHELGELDRIENGAVVQVLSLKETSERNSLEPKYKHVIRANMVIENPTNEEMLLTMHDFTLISADGFQAEPYSDGDIMKSIAPHSKARVNFRYGTDDDGPYKISAGHIVWE